MSDRPKFLVIGLDGADLDVLVPFFDAGELPHLAALAAEGVSGYLRSTLPPISAPAWATFMTGRRPGGHGLFGFVSERLDGKGTLLAEYARIRGDRLWDVFSREGRRVAVANVPVTWPPPPVNGVFVAGMLTPPGAPFTNPPELEAELLAAAPGYRIDVDRNLFADRASFLADIHATVAALAAAFLHLLGREPWDLFVGVFTGTDRVQHHFWRREREEILGLFRRVDGAVGEMLARVDRERTTVLVVSDHGFTGTDRRFYANRWLARHGYLRTKRVREDRDDYRRRRFNFFLDEPEEARHRERGVRGLLRRFGLRGPRAIDWSRTRAYLYTSDTRGIHVNLRGRQPAGIVPPGDYEALRTELVERLTALEFPETGERVFSGVFRREEVYEGPAVEDAPDILLEPDRDRYRVVSRVGGRRFLRAHSRPGGFHRRPGLLLAAGPGVRSGATVEGAGLEDVMPTLLAAAGLPVPDGVDGRVLAELFTEERRAALDVRRVPATPDAPPPPPADLTAEQDEILRRQLRDLGYL